MKDKKIYTTAQVCKMTGYSYLFLKEFIPWPLKPKGWEDMSMNEQAERLSKGNLLFTKEAVRDFEVMIFREIYKNWEIIKSLKQIDGAIEQVFRVLTKMDKYLFDFTELMTLKEVAKELNYKNPGSLRNKIRRVDEDGASPTGILELPGFKLKLHKVKGEWIVNRFDFYEQVKKLGFTKRMNYFRRRKPEQ